MPTIEISKTDTDIIYGIFSCIWSRKIKFTIFGCRGQGN